jgi:hypothetical protein
MLRHRALGPTPVNVAVLLGARGRCRGACEKHRVRDIESGTRRFWTTVFAQHMTERDEGLKSSHAFGHG